MNAQLVAVTRGGSSSASRINAVRSLGSGIATRAIAQAMGAGLGVPVASIACDDAMTHFGSIRHYFGVDMTASDTLTRELLAWDPTRQGLREDLAKRYYFDES